MNIATTGAMALAVREALRSGGAVDHLVPAGVLAALRATGEEIRGLRVGAILSGARQSLLNASSFPPVDRHAISESIDT